MYEVLRKGEWTPVTDAQAEAFVALIEEGKLPADYLRQTEEPQSGKLSDDPREVTEGMPLWKKNVYSVFPRTARRGIAGEGNILGDIGAGIADVASLPGRAVTSFLGGGVPDMGRLTPREDQNIAIGIGEQFLRDPLLVTLPMGGGAVSKGVKALSGVLGAGRKATAAGTMLGGGVLGSGYSALSHLDQELGLSAKEDESLASEMLTGALVGGGLPVAISGVKGAIGSARRTVQPVIEGISPRVSAVVEEIAPTPLPPRAVQQAQKKVVEFGEKKLGLKQEELMQSTKHGVRSSESNAERQLGSDVVNGQQTIDKWLNNIEKLDDYFDNSLRDVGNFKGGKWSGRTDYTLEEIGDNLRTAVNARRDELFEGATYKKLASELKTVEGLPSGSEVAILKNKERVISELKGRARQLKSEASSATKEGKQYIKKATDQIDELVEAVESADVDGSILEFFNTIRMDMAEKAYKAPVNMYGRLSREQKLYQDLEKISRNAFKDNLKSIDPKASIELEKNLKQMTDHFGGEGLYKKSLGDLSKDPAQVAKGAFTNTQTAKAYHNVLKSLKGVEDGDQFFKANFRSFVRDQLIDRDPNGVINWARTRRNLRGKETMFNFLGERKLYGQLMEGIDFGVSLSQPMGLGSSGQHSFAGIGEAGGFKGAVRRATQKAVNPRPDLSPYEYEVLTAPSGSARSALFGAEIGSREAEDFKQDQAERKGRLEALLGW